VNEFGQILYPRYELFQQIVEVFKKSGKSVPVFCDKHLSYDHKKAAEMVATAKKMGFGLMAGSSLLALLSPSVRHLERRVEPAGDEVGAS